MTSFGGNVNDFESRLGHLERRAPTAELPTVEVTATTTDATGTTLVPLVTDPLDYNVGGWASYATLTGHVGADGVPTGTWSDGDEGYMQPQAHRIGGVIFLAGVIRRTGPTIAVNTLANSVMFRLPATWRPARSVVLSCLCNTSVAPNIAPTVGRAVVMVTPNLTQNAGLVTLVSANVALNTGVGWVSLGGTFPGMFVGDASV